MKDRVFYIYKITNKITGASYIGRSYDPKNRWQNHKWKALYSEKVNHQRDCVKFYNSLRKYGAHNFLGPEILIGTKNYDNVVFLESYFIKYFDTVEFGLNCNYGCAGGGKLSNPEQAKRNMSIGKKKIKYLQGETNPKATMTNDVAKEIKILLAKGVSIQEIVQRFGTTIRRVRNIKYGRTWKHIEISSEDME